MGGFGYQEDATGLRLLGHRYYDSSTGRFLTRDPMRDGRNWYSYCGNDPLNARDPNGLLATGSYLGDVWEVFKGYGDAINPINWVKGIAHCIEVGSDRGAWEGVKEFGRGIWNSIKFWEAEDPRDFGNRFGGSLLTAVAVVAPFAEGGAAAAGASNAGKGGIAAKLAKPDVVITEHGGLPWSGPPGGTGAKFGPNGLKQIRVWADDGNPLIDIDWGHNHGAGDPHYHLFTEGVRDLGNPF